MSGRQQFYRVAAAHLLIVIGLGWSASAHADSAAHLHHPVPEALITDRPSEADSSETVAKRHFQFETSFAYLQDTEGGRTTRHYSFPTVMRYGLFSSLEVRLAGELFAIQTETGMSTVHGVPDIALGLKGHLRDDDQWRPAVGWQAQVSLPTGSGPFSSHTIAPVGKMITEWSLPENFLLDINIGIDLPARDASGNRFARFLYAAEITHPAPIFPGRLTLFLETAGVAPLHSEKASDWLFDTGFTYLLSADMQLDSFVKIGLTEVTPGLQTGLGFSWRW